MYSPRPVNPTHTVSDHRKTATASYYPYTKSTCIVYYIKKNPFTSQSDGTNSQHNHQRGMCSFPPQHRSRNPIHCDRPPPASQTAILITAAQQRALSLNALLRRELRVSYPISAQAPATTTTTSTATTSTPPASSRSRRPSTRQRRPPRVETHCCSSSSAADPSNSLAHAASSQSPRAAAVEVARYYTRYLSTWRSLAVFRSETAEDAAR